MFRVLRIYNFDLRESQRESSDTACNKSCIACYSKLCTIVLVQCYYLYTILLEQYVVHTYLSMWKKAKVHCQYSQLKAVCAVESVQSLNLNWSINPKVHIVFSQVLAFFVSIISSVCFEKFFEVHYMSVGQKLAMLKFRSTSVTLLSLRDLEAAPEETMQLRRLIKSSNESLGPYLFGKIEFWNFF